MTTKKSAQRIQIYDETNWIDLKYSSVYSFFNELWFLFCFIRANLHRIWNNDTTKMTSIELKYCTNRLKLHVCY